MLASVVWLLSDLVEVELLNKMIHSGLCARSYWLRQFASTVNTKFVLVASGGGLYIDVGHNVAGLYPKRKTNAQCYRTWNCCDSHCNLCSLVAVSGTGKDRLIEIRLASGLTESPTFE